MTLTKDYPVGVVCKVLNFPRSSYYYQAGIPDDEVIRDAIKKLASQWPTYGYRRITQMLKREGVEVNHKRVYRLMSKLDLLKVKSAKKKTTTNSNHSFQRYPNLVTNLLINRPEHVWVADITYIALEDEFVYLAVIMDVFTRDIRGWHLGRSLDQSLTLTALKKALGRYQAPVIHHSDQGVQYASTNYVRLLEGAGVNISMAEVGEPTQNGYAERLIRTIKEEEVALSDYQDFQDAYSQIGRFLDDVYRQKRIHSSLGYLTPTEFEEQWLKE